MNPIIKPGWELVYKHDGSKVHTGDKVATSKRDYVATVTGGRPPHHAGSTGRVFVFNPSTNREEEYFPQCFDLEWQTH